MRVLYNILRKDYRNLEIALTYEEFLEFTKIKECHYCGGKNSFGIHMAL